MNSDEFAEFDRELQWETLRIHDNEAGPFNEAELRAQPWLTVEPASMLLKSE